MNLHSTLVRPLAFRLDPERAHHFAIAAAASSGWAAGPMRAVTAVEDARLAPRIAGLDFPIPIGWPPAVGSQ
jgi:dihydroorotate dehydrogenase